MNLTKTYSRILRFGRSMISLFSLFNGFIALSQTATVTIEVTWPNFAEENGVQIRNTTNTTILYQDCTPNCFSGDGSNTAYTNTGSVVLPYGGYSLLLFDRFNNGWAGASSVRVFIDGVLEVDNDLLNGESVKIVGFSVYDTSIPQDVDLTLFDQFNGYYDYALTGGTLRTNSDATDPCSITTNSSNTLTTTIPPTANIEKAYLFWAHSGFNQDEQVTFEGETVNAIVTKQFHSQQISFFGMVGDVTDIVRGITNPSSNTYNFEDLTIDNDNIDSFFCGSTTLGGWALKIFYTDPSLPAVRINLYDGFSGEVNSFSDYTLDGFFAINTAGAKTTILSWEGDDEISGGEELRLTTSVNSFELKGDGTNVGATDNPFNSTIFDDTAPTTVNITDSYGVDLDTYDISSFINIGETTATTRVTAGGDIVLLNSVVLKVPSNLITGTVFEDINYPGDQGRDQTSSSGIGIPGVTIELYDITNSLVQTTTTDTDGAYVFAGMANGTYRVRVVNNTVQSTRGGGTACVNCLPIQTFRRSYMASTLTDVPNEVGGADPTATDVGSGSLTDAQTISSVAILNEGVVDLDFGFNFNTIVNTNKEGQGSLRQFIINSNELNENGLDIEAHPNDASFNPATGEDTSIFMIPSDSDPLGRAADPGYISADGYFDILQDDSNLESISSNNTFIDGRSQTAYQDTNTGFIGTGGVAVGINGTILPQYPLPEIQVRRDNPGFVIDITASNIGIRNIALYGNTINTDGIRVTTGSAIVITQNLISTNALGTPSGTTRNGVRVSGNTNSTVDGNFLSGSRQNGVRVNSSSSVNIINNHFFRNGRTRCDSNIKINGGGDDVIIQNNLIEDGSEYGIDQLGGDNLIITQNTIIDTGLTSTCNDAIVLSTSKAGIRLTVNNAMINQNIITNNGRMGIYVGDATSTGSLISQNAIYANGTVTPSLGIDLGDIGVTTNDAGDGDTGPNELYNFPFFESVTISGTSLRLIGWARPGAIIEVFLSDIDQGTATAGDNTVGAGITQDYGEGQIYLGTITEGSVNDSNAATSLYSDVDLNTDTTERFNITLNLTSTIPVGSLITATATSPSTNSTSEFGSTFVVRTATVITNRQRTYRVRRN